MTRKYILMAILLSGISLLAGMYFPQMKEILLHEQKAWQDVGALVSIPEKGVKTNELSVRLFRETAEQYQGRQNTFISPYLTLAILEELAVSSAGEPQQLLNKSLSLQSEEATPLTIPIFDTLAACDSTLPLPHSKAFTLRLPFKENRPDAQSFFNTALALAVHDSSLQVLTSENTSEFTRFVIGGACHMKPIWQVPFTKNNTIRADFYNQDGAIPRVDMMRCRGLIRTAEAEDNSWTAVALFFKPNQSGNTPVAFIGILPTRGTQHAIDKFTAEELSNIRQRLAQAEPKDCQVELPRIICETPVVNNNQLMEKMGFGFLFDAQKADFSPISSQKIALDGIFSQIGLVLVENQPHGEAIAVNAPHRITFDKPFIWLISDLTTDIPPYYMGLLLNL